MFDSTFKFIFLYENFNKDLDLWYFISKTTEFLKNKAFYLSKKSFVNKFTLIVRLHF